MSEQVGKKVNIPILSFFTGAGFLDMGFIKAGFNIVWHNEINPEFARGFSYGMRAWYQKTGRDIAELKDPVVASIEDLSKEDIIRGAFGGKYLPDDFGIIGGPPCPDFSVGGKNRGRYGENGRLSKTYVDWICDLQPTFFLFENVPGLLRTAKHRWFLWELVKQLQECGYLTDLKVVNALDYGVPQDRERILLVGVHERWLKRNGKMPSGLSPEQELVTERWFPFPEPKYKDAKTRFTWPSITEFGGDGGPVPEGTPRELMVGTYILDQNELAKLENSQDVFRSYSDKFTKIPEGDDSRKSFKRLHRYRYSPTAAYGNNEVHLHPTEPRRLSVREAMRIQSVPDEYALPPDMSLSDKFKTVANGVPVLLAEAVANAFRKFLTE